MTPVVQADKLSKWYGPVLGISEVSLAVSGGIHGLLGPNGAGKSTFLKLVSGQLRPSLGTIRVFGQPAFGNPGLFRRMGFCPDVDSYYLELSGQEFLAALASLHGFSGSEGRERVAAALERVGLTEAAGRRVRAYSYGMRQRLRLAGSTLHDPEFLLLDEPLRGIDPLWRIRIVRWIRDYATAGRTVIVSSHILSEIESMTSQIILIHQGKIFAEGDVSSIRDMIEAHPHQIRLGGPRVREVARELLGSDLVVRVELDDTKGQAVFQTRHRDRFFSRLTELAASHPDWIAEVEAADDNLQAVFDYLVKR
ncbi:MAG TPA: ABC transporter ATP-binding protein [Candidatus Aminicenantes bacterium]|nr:ABC transporter ATP-binding protein [Candidatus Aminicenantes bacterium]